VSGEKEEEDDLRRKKVYRDKKCIYICDVYARACVCVCSSVCGLSKGGKLLILTSGR